MHNTDQKPIVVCVSGGGRSLQNLLTLEKKSNFFVSGVISSSSSCKANEIARKHNKPIYCAKFPINGRDSEYKENAIKLKSFIESSEAELIVLAGFLRPFPLDICAKTIPTINIHPALLPKFGGHGMYGKKVHEAVIASSDGESGATIHFVTPVYDEGKIISQIIVKRLKEDCAEGLATRVFEAEKKLLPLTITKLLKGELPLKENSIYKI
jgi:phosphoribosylglycinamide formyltransferase 1